MNAMSALEYAVKALRVKTVMVTGHYGCGAVRAALSLPSRTPGLVNCWISDIREARNQAARELSSLPPERQVRRLCELNVLRQVFHVCTSPVVQQAWAEGQELHVWGLIYDVADGRLRPLAGPISAETEVTPTVDAFVAAGSGGGAVWDAAAAAAAAGAGAARGTSACVVAAAANAAVEAQQRQEAAAAAAQQQQQQPEQQPQRTDSGKSGGGGGKGGGRAGKLSFGGLSLSLGRSKGAKRSGSSGGGGRGSSGGGSGTGHHHNGDCCAEALVAATTAPPLAEGGGCDAPCCPPAAVANSAVLAKAVVRHTAWAADAEATSIAEAARVVQK